MHFSSRQSYNCSFQLPETVEANSQYVERHPTLGSPDNLESDDTYFHWKQYLPLFYYSFTSNLIPSSRYIFRLLSSVSVTVRLCSLPKAPFSQMSILPESSFRLIAFFNTGSFFVMLLRGF